MYLHQLLFSLCGRSRVRISPCRINNGWQKLINQLIKSLIGETYTHKYSERIKRKKEKSTLETLARELTYCRGKKKTSKEKKKNVPSKPLRASSASSCIFSSCVLCACSKVCQHAAVTSSAR
jgi:hypothetical protein